MRYRLIIAALSLTALSGAVRAEEKFQPTVESLRQYECSEWFRDAKFGIYLHWGAYSVAEQGEWYARKLYDETTPEYKHHLLYDVKRDELFFELPVMRWMGKLQNLLYPLLPNH